MTGITCSRQGYVMVIFGIYNKVLLTLQAETSVKIVKMLMLNERYYVSYGLGYFLVISTGIL